MKTIIYCRKSTEQADRQVNSIEDQYKECLSYTKFLADKQFEYIKPPEDSEREDCWAESKSSWYADKRSIY